MDRLFSNSRIVSLLMSGLIGITIFTFATGPDSLDGQNKYFFIVLGYPLWTIIKMIYWTSRTNHLIEMYKTDNINHRKTMDSLRKINPSKAEYIEQNIVISMMHTISNKKNNPIEAPVSNENNNPVEVPISSEKIKAVEEYIFNNDRFDNNFLNAYNSVSRDTNAHLELMDEASKNYLKSQYPLLDTVTGEINSYNKLMGSCFIIGYNIKVAEIIFNFNIIFNLNHDSTILEILQSSLSHQEKVVKIALYKEKNNTLINFGEEFRKYTYFKLEELQGYLDLILHDFLSQNHDSFEELHIDKDAFLEFVYRNAILGYSFKIAEQLIVDYNFFKYTRISSYEDNPKLEKININTGYSGKVYPISFKDLNISKNMNVKHNTFGIGKIVSFDENSLDINFMDGKTRKFDRKVCENNDLLTPCS